MDLFDTASEKFTPLNEFDEMSESWDKLARGTRAGALILGLCGFLVAILFQSVTFLWANVIVVCLALIASLVFNCIGDHYFSKALKELGTPASTLSTNVGRLSHADSSLFHNSYDRWKS